MSVVFIIFQSELQQARQQNMTYNGVTCGRMLGHLYAAEALVLLDKISDAIGHLNPEHVKDHTLTFPSAEKEADWEKADMGAEQHKPLNEAESNQHYQAMHRMCTVSHKKAVLNAVSSNSICYVCVQLGSPTHLRRLER